MTITDAPETPDEVLAGSPDVENLPVLLARGTDVAATLDERIRVAEVLSEAGMLPQQYRGNRGNVLAVQFAADALNIPLFTAFQHLHIVKGKVGMSAELMRALMRRAGIRYKIDSDTKLATMRLKLPDDPDWVTASFTIETAIHAGLCRRDANTGKVVARSNSGEILPWEAHTEALLVARATSKIARMYCPEVLQGMSYTQDELEEATRVNAVPTVVQVPKTEAAPVEVRPEMPSSADQAMVHLIKTMDIDHVRELFRHSSRQSWLDAEYGGLPLRAHMVAAQQGLKGKKPKPYGDIAHCATSTNHDEHVWFNDAGVIGLCEGVEVVDGEIVVEGDDYPEVDVPEQNFGDTE